MILNIINSDNPSNHRKSSRKKLRDDSKIVGFSEAFDSIHRGKMEQIFLVFSLPPKNPYNYNDVLKNTKVNVRSPDEDTDFFDIAAGVLPGNKFAPYLFIICIDYVFRTSINLMKNKWLYTKKARNRRYPIEHITEADNADNSASCK